MAGQVEATRNSSTTIIGMRSDIDAIEPIPRGIMRSEPPPLDHFGERVVGVLKIELPADRAGHSDHTLAIERHELTLGKDLDVLQIMLFLEALSRIERRKTNFLKPFELRRRLRGGRG